MHPAASKGIRFVYAAVNCWYEDDVVCGELNTVVRDVATGGGDETVLRLVCVAVEDVVRNRSCVGQEVTSEAACHNPRSTSLMNLISSLGLVLKSAVQAMPW